MDHKWWNDCLMPHYNGATSELATILTNKKFFEKKVDVGHSGSNKMQRLRKIATAMRWIEGNACHGVEVAVQSIEAIVQGGEVGAIGERKVWAEGGCAHAQQ